MNFRAPHSGGATGDESLTACTLALLWVLWARGVGGWGRGWHACTLSLDDDGSVFVQVRTLRHRSIKTCAVSCSVLIAVSLGP